MNRKKIIKKEYKKKRKLLRNVRTWSTTKRGTTKRGPTKIADEEAGSRGIKTAGILKFGKGKVALASSVRDQSHSRRIVSSRRPGLSQRVASARSQRVASKYGDDKLPRPTTPKPTTLPTPTLL